IPPYDYYLPVSDNCLRNRTIHIVIKGDVSWILCFKKSQTGFRSMTETGTHLTDEQKSVSPRSLANHLESSKIQAYSLKHLTIQRSLNKQVGKIAPFVQKISISSHQCFQKKSLIKGK